MSNIDKLQNDLSNLPEEEQLIFIFYTCEVSSHPFVQLDQIGGSTHYRIIKSLANQNPSIPFDMPRQTFYRKSHEIMKMAEAAKNLRSGGKASFSPTMKKKNEAIAKLGGKAEAILDAPPAPHVSSQWVHSEFVPGTQNTKSVVVTMHRYLMYSMVTIASFKKEWETARRLRIDVVYPGYFTNPLVTSATLVDSKGNKLMEGDHAAISSGFERSAKEQTESGKKQPVSSFYVTYEEDQDKKEFFDMGEGHRGFYLQPGKARRADGKICEFEELCVVTKEYCKEEEDPDAEEIIERAHEAPVFDTQSMWGGANSNPTANSNGFHENLNRASRNTANPFAHQQPNGATKNNVQPPTYTAKTETSNRSVPPPTDNYTFVQQPNGGAFSNNVQPAAANPLGDFSALRDTVMQLQQSLARQQLQEAENLRRFQQEQKHQAEEMRRRQEDSDRALQESKQAALYAIQQQEVLRRQQEEARRQQEELCRQQEQQKLESRQREEELHRQQEQQKQQQEHMINSFHYQQQQQQQQQHQQTQIRVDALSTAVAQKPASRPDQKRLADDSAQHSVSSRSKRARQTVVSGGDDDDDSMFSGASQIFVPTIPDDIQVQTVVAPIQT